MSQRYGSLLCFESCWINFEDAASADAWDETDETTLSSQKNPLSSLRNVGDDISLHFFAFLALPFLENTDKPTSTTSSSKMGNPS